MEFINSCATCSYLRATDDEADSPAKQTEGRIEGGERRKRKGLARVLVYIYACTCAHVGTGPSAKAVFKNDFRERTLRDLSPIAGPLPRIRETLRLSRADAWLVSHKLRESFKVKRAARPGASRPNTSRLWKSCITLRVPLTRHRGPAFYVCARRTSTTDAAATRRLSAQPPDDPASLVANKLTSPLLFRLSRYRFYRARPRSPVPRRPRCTAESLDDDD